MKLILTFYAFNAMLPTLSYGQERRPYNQFYEDVKKRHAYDSRQEKLRNAEQLKAFKAIKKQELNAIKSQNNIDLEKLKNKTIYGIEILTASSNLNEVASVFGHSTIRLIMGNNPLDDVIIGPEAFVNDPEVDSVKGMAGGYTIIPRMMNFLDFMISYHRGEYRSIIRTLVPTTLQMRKNLIDAISELNNNPLSFGKDGYKFKTNNCASIVLKLLGKASIINGSGDTGVDWMEKLSLAAVIKPLAVVFAPFGLAHDAPVSVIHHLKEWHVITMPNSYIPAIDIFFSEMKTLKGKSLSKKISDWTKEDLLLFPKLSQRALYMLYLGPIELPEKLKNYVISLVKIKGQKINLYEMYNLVSYDHKLYQICPDTACAKEQYQIIKKSWPRSERFKNSNTFGEQKKYDIDQYFRFDEVEESHPFPLNEYQIYNIYMQNLYDHDYVSS
ncbi:MAG: DUF4105 domain-containing protein [Bdellovibrionota bacterium]